MRIQHNIAALNSYRQLNGNNNAVSKNLEKLSSGYRINRAGDDAAGLAISEKMRAQIKGLETAQKNANDGISLVQTAEGALTEVHSMLNRMVELATQSANGTYDNETDRANLQKEVESLKKEIDRIAESTNYNGIKLLDGSLGVTGSGQAVSGGKVSYVDGLETTTLKATSHKFGLTADSTVAANTELKIEYMDEEGKVKTASLKGDGTKTISELVNDDAELSQLFKATAGAAGVPAGIETIKAGSNAAKILSVTNNGTAVAPSTDSVVGADARTALKLPAAADGDVTFTIGDKTFQVITSGSSVTKAEKGNIEIKAAGAQVTAQELVAALKKAGITSASITKDENNDDVIQITDESQMQVDAKGVAVDVDPTAGTVVATKATKNEFSITDAAGSGKDAKLTLDFIDKDGNAQKITVDYKSVSAAADASGAQNTKAMLDALSTNAEFNKNFEIDGDKIKAKNSGTDGAKIGSFSTTDRMDGASENLQINGRFTAAVNASKSVDFKEIGSGTTVTVNGKTYEFVQDGKDVKGAGNIAVSLGSGDTTAEKLENSVKNLANALGAEGVDVTRNGTKLTFSNEGAKIGGSDKGLVLQVGDTSDDYQKVTVQVGDMSTKSLGIDGIDISTQEGASAALDKIKAAINIVSSTRGDLGAIQNRLEHTINNLGVATENMTAAESRIRDTDMASEMMTFTKNNILTQAAQAMMAQANQIPQGVLQLLQ